MDLIGHVVQIIVEIGIVIVRRFFLFFIFSYKFRRDDRSRRILFRFFVYQIGKPGQND